MSAVEKNPGATIKDKAGAAAPLASRVYSPLLGVPVPQKLVDEINARLQGRSTGESDYLMKRISILLLSKPDIPTGDFSRFCDAVCSRLEFARGLANLNLHSRVCQDAAAMSCGALSETEVHVLEMTLWADFLEMRTYPIRREAAAKYSKETAIDPISLEGYSLQFATMTSIGESCDGWYAFILKFEEHPIARISFNAVPGGIRVVQIQGAKGEEPDGLPALSRLRWPRLLLDCVCEWASDMGIKTVEVQSANNSSCVQDAIYAKGPAHMDFRRVYIRYDVTAMRAGFDKTPYGDYAKELEPGRYISDPIWWLAF